MQQRALTRSAGRAVAPSSLRLARSTVAAPARHIGAAPLICKAALAMEMDINMGVADAPDVTLQSWEMDVLELDQETFHTFLRNTSDRVVVVDFFTNWCGPCKAMAPFIEELAGTMDPRKVLFVKVNCQDNMKLAKELNIKSLPTFHLYRGEEKVAQITGSKREGLVELINTTIGAPVSQPVAHVVA